MGSYCKYGNAAAKCGDLVKGGMWIRESRFWTLFDLFCGFKSKKLLI